MRYVWLLAGLAACNNDLGLVSAPKVPPAPPPGDPTTTNGAPPDWNSCFQGWRGEYYNLRVTDKFVDPRPNDPPAPDTPEKFPYWDQPESFENFDPSLDFGQNWWPVDDGLAGDPAYFAVHWDAWLRAWSGTNFQFMLGSQDDSWVYVNGEPIASKPGIQPFVRDVYNEYIDAGQYPIEVWFIHRGSETSGFSFRPIDGDVSICYPDFGTPTN
jgi:hypothetical protein